MGIKRRMIDIGKKITFYFLQNVWKCTVFFAFAFKVFYCSLYWHSPTTQFIASIYHVFSGRKSRFPSWMLTVLCFILNISLKLIAASFTRRNNILLQLIILTPYCIAQNGRRKQKSGQHNPARQKYTKNVHLLDRN